MFDLKSNDKNARLGVLYTPNGKMDTPAFMPVATKGCVKSLSSDQVISTYTQGLICNAFLLYLKPGVEVISDAGGIHDFMNWKRTLFTDSGGFQMLKKEFLISVDKDGILFRSPFDNSSHLMTPQKCMEIQGALGSDIAMVLDDVPRFNSSYDRALTSIRHTIEWAKLCKEHKIDNQQLFSIIQGGLFTKLREKCTEKLVDIGFDGYGIGGLSIGEPKKMMYKTIKDTTPLLPEKSPRYLMGVGSPMELLEAISLGIDIFDSAFPTRNARHNTAYTKKGKLNLTRGKFRIDFAPLEDRCKCLACKYYTRAYIHHLFKVHEQLGMNLVTIHNIYFIQKILRESRDAIKRDEFYDYKNSFKGYY